MNDLFRVEIHQLVKKGFRQNPEELSSFTKEINHILFDSLSVDINQPYETNEVFLSFNGFKDNEELFCFFEKVYDFFSAEIDFNHSDLEGIATTQNPTIKNQYISRSLADSQYNIGIQIEPLKICVRITASL